MGRDYRKGGGPTDSGKRGDGVVVNGYSQQWLERGFPWVYREEVLGRTGQLQPGCEVSIRARGGKLLGVGIWDKGKVEVRRFRSDAGAIDRDLLQDLVDAARVRRVVPPDTTCWRWIHGENDDLPGVRVDCWGDQLSVVLDSPSLLPLLDTLIEVLTTSRHTTAVWLSWRLAEGVAIPRGGLPDGLVWGTAEREEVEVEECGVKMWVRPWDGLAAGVYADMRDLRRWLQPHWVGQRVLNTFAFTGLFSVAAAVHGASETVSVDLSAAAMERAQDNFRLNGLNPDNHVFEARDTFKALDAHRRKGERFDIVVADPPSFSHAEDGTWAASRDYPRLVAACLRVLRPGGWLIMASNQGSVSPKEFQKFLLQGSRRTRRPLRLVHVASPPMDFPAALDFPESRYLKCWVMQA